MWQANSRDHRLGAMLGAVIAPLPHHELAARARAALAYAGVEYREIYEALHVDRTTFARKLGKKGSDRRSTLSEKEIAYIVERTGVPEAWFTADFSRLAEIPSPPPRAVPDVAAEAAQLRDDKTETPRESADDHPGSGRAA